MLHEPDSGIKNSVITRVVVIKRRTREKGFFSFGYRISRIVLSCYLKENNPKHHLITFD